MKTKMEENKFKMNLAGTVYEDVNITQEFCVGSAERVVSTVKY